MRQTAKRSFAKIGGRMLTIEMKLFDLVLAICHFSWQICQLSIVKDCIQFCQGRPWQALAALSLGKRGCQGSLVALLPRPAKAMP